jgi:hypothetical protein
MSQMPTTRPQQQRAIETTNRILEAAYDIVAFDGYQALTTNAVAERANVNIRSVYRYFEDKNAIILHLAQKQRDERAITFGTQFFKITTAENLDDWVEETLRLGLKIRTADPRANPLFKVIHAHPEFAEFTKAADAEVEEGLGRALRARFPLLSVRRSQFAARVCYDLAQSFFNNFELAGNRVEDYLKETGAAATLYLKSLEEQDQ